MLRVRLTEFLDKLVLLAAMLLFTGVGLRAIIEVRELDRMSGGGRPMLSEMKLNAPRYDAAAPEVETASWRAAQSQSRGEDWIFDVFTPPVIYYDPTSREFAVTPPSKAVAEAGDDQWANFDVQLIEVRLRPYKLQLVGYAGEVGTFVAYFENTSTGEIVLLREGQEESSLGVRLRSFQVRQIETRNEEDTPVLQSVGVARLADYATGQEISLTNQETKMYADLEARVRVMPTGAIRFVQVGTRLELDSGDYLIEDLSAQPQEAMITKVSKDGSRRFSKTVTPVPTPEIKSRGSSQEPSPQSPFAIRPKILNRKPQG